MTRFEQIVALLPPKLQDKAKTVVGALGSVLAILAFYYSDSTLLIALLEIFTVLGVYATPNVGYVNDARHLAND